MVHDSRMDDPVFEPDVTIILTEPKDQEMDRDDIPKDCDGKPIEVKPLKEKLKEHYEKKQKEKEQKIKKFGTRLAPQSADRFVIIWLGCF